MRAMLRLGLKGLFAPLNLWLWVTLKLRWSGIGVLTRQLIAAAVSPVRERQLPLVVSTTES